MAPIVRFTSLLASVRTLFPERGRVRLGRAVVRGGPRADAARLNLRAPRVRVATL